MVNPRTTINTFTKYNIVVITPNPTRELEWTVDLFDELIGVQESKCLGGVKHLLQDKYKICACIQVCNSMRDV